MVNIFEVIKSLYLKNKVAYNITTSELMIINKYLLLDTNNLSSLKKIINYIFYLNPNNYYYLLYILLPQKTTVPFLNLKKYSLDKIIENDYTNRLKEVLEVGENDIKYNKPILDKLNLEKLL